VDFLNELLPWVLIGGFLFMMFRGGGCCGGHGHGTRGHGEENINQNEHGHHDNGEDKRAG